MAMITISIARTNYKPETIDIKSNIDIDDSQSKVKVPDNEDKPIHYVRFTNQKRPFIELDRSTTSAGKASFYVKIISDLDHTSKFASFAQNKDQHCDGDMHEDCKRCHCHNKVKHCSGNVCPRCHKCIGCSYDGDIRDDYKRYHSDEKVEHCDGNACSRCGKCIDWSYDGNMHDDYQLYLRDNKHDRILDRKHWRRRSHATCSFYCVHSHFYQYYHSYHSHYCGYPNCTVCDCKN